MTAPATFTDSGIHGVGNVPWGAHICHWYVKAADLAACHTPYIAAGLRDGERCFWLTGAPYEAAQAKQDLGRVFPGADEARERGALSVLDIREWYTAGGGFRGPDLVEYWLGQERAALQAGYAGIRIAGNTSFVQRQDWVSFLEYEHAFNDAVARGHKVVALCSYNLLDQGATDMFDVVNRHALSLHREGDGWRALESARTM